MANRLFIGVAGNQNWGKSTTWYELFDTEYRKDKKVRETREVKKIDTCKYPKKLQISEDKGIFVDAFVINASPKEKGKFISDFIENQDCKIILCSLWYKEVFCTLKYLKESEDDFEMHVQCLNPGHNGEKYPDYNDLEERCKQLGAKFDKKDGSVDPPTERVNKILNIIKEWVCTPCQINID